MSREVISIEKIPDEIKEAACKIEEYMALNERHHWRLMGICDRKILDEPDCATSPMYDVHSGNNRTHQNVCHRCGGPMREVQRQTYRPAYMEPSMYPDVDGAFPYGMGDTIERSVTGLKCEVCCAEVIFSERRETRPEPARPESVQESPIGIEPPIEPMSATEARARLDRAYASSPFSVTHSRGSRLLEQLQSYSNSIDRLNEANQRQREEQARAVSQADCERFDEAAVQALRDSWNQEQSPTPPSSSEAGQESTDL